MDEQKQYKMAKALQDGANWSVLDCLALASCIEYVMENCLENPAFATEYGAAIVRIIKTWQNPA